MSRSSPKVSSRSPQCPNKPAPETLTSSLTSSLTSEAKYNQLMRIEEELGSACAYAGETWRKPTWMA